MRRMILANLIAIACLVSVAAPAAGYELLTLKVLGFLDDGRSFAFAAGNEPPVEGAEIRETWAIDVATGRVIGGHPARFQFNEDGDPAGARPARLATFGRESAALLAIARPRVPGAIVAAATAAQLGDRDGPATDARLESVRFDGRTAGSVTLSLRRTDRPWPPSARLTDHPDAPRCAVATGTRTRTVAVVDLQRVVRGEVERASLSVPELPGCIADYGIAEVRTLQRPDGALAVAVVLAVYTLGFEGNDRSFVAVTKLLKS